MTPTRRTRREDRMEIWLLLLMAIALVALTACR